MKVTAYLTQADLHQAVTNYLKLKGFNATTVNFHVTREDRQLDVDRIEASALCDTKPQTTNRGGSSDGYELEGTRNPDLHFG